MPEKKRKEVHKKALSYFELHFLFQHFVGREREERFPSN